MKPDFSLLDKRIFDKIKRLNEMLPNGKVAVYNIDKHKFEMISQDESKLYPQGIKSIKYFE